MLTYDVMIVFSDGTEKLISRASDIVANAELKIFQVLKNGYYIFIPMEHVLYIGRKYDLEVKN